MVYFDENKSLSKRCNLCLNEKYIIICHPEKATLNKRNELELYLHIDIDENTY